MSDTQDPPTEESPTDQSESIDGEYDPSEIEPKWQDHWVAEDTYAYDGDADTRFTIDTPPPTVSGNLHMGHLYQFTLQDFVARYHRMADDTVYFPFGYDDNGIASERLTERELDIRHQDFERREFQEKCREVCTRYEDEFTEDVQSLAISVDWDNTYKTIAPEVQRVSQLSFLDLYEQGREYRQRAPTIWCPDCETAISQVEQEDEDKSTKFNDIAFDLVEDGDGPVEDETFTISTTRPELLPACVSVFVHPDDDANQHLVGGTARVPLFGQEVPIIADERVDMETGSGLVMCCTFGDQNDIEWYQAHDLDLRLAIDESATMTEVAGDYEGMSTTQARAAIIEDLDVEGYLLESRDHEHTVQVHERCGVEVEYLVTEQWYIKLLDKKDEYLQAGRDMEWFPEKMYSRYQHWIEGLEWDWCISRQRDSGIPIPVWYCDECGEPILADPEQLPADPLSDDPPVDGCPDCGHDTFTPEEDVFDTWATSSLTPLVNAGWDWHADADAAEPNSITDGTFEMEMPELYPFDLRPQGHDIISFWLFHTVVKCYEHTDEVPFENVMVNGMVLDENREAMSKSKGNVIPPSEVLENFPVDAARYWAAGTSIGDDFPYKEGDLEAGERLLQKLWNASRLVDQLTPAHDAVGDVDEADLSAVDRWLLAELDATIDSVTAKFEDYAFSKARNELRSFFWNTFCDDYLEIAKQRLSDGGDPSTEYTLLTAHRTFLKLFAPFLPHITEELWSRVYGEDESVHTTDWPVAGGYEADLEAGETAMEVVSALRRYKTENGLPLNADLEHVEVYGHVEGFAAAIAEAMHVDRLETFEDAPDITTEVSDIDLDYSIVGPEFGSDVGALDSAIEAGDYEIDGDTLVVAGGEFELDAEMFAVEESRTYSGEGEMTETENAVVVVR
ncbi:valine--tRNA ligase [Haloarcula pellucida]|uniref:Valine--tRNA ligase n=1 Tax=Haloarcula pellucida TaxID=1427151 RepID=A0A830GPG0_9EURY|nr:valine--tRNA ligase [Halomicroarcula pellucida]MBX0348301.1 valine--tRNA ligase [Halomicroarcula pellucida]GGN97912.1 valine--tRNA ligase [Halomicroarcula pellucida]